MAVASSTPGIPSQDTFQTALLKALGGVWSSFYAL
jgi:hypothetical protein